MKVLSCICRRIYGRPTVIPLEHGDVSEAGPDLFAGNAVATCRRRILVTPMATRPVSFKS
jgi:hypothetical protein